MNPLDKYKGVICSLESKKNCKTTAFGHMIESQSGYIDNALIEGKKSLNEIKIFLLAQPDIDKKRRNPNDLQTLERKIIDHLRWLAGEDKNKGFRNQINKVSGYSDLEKTQIYNDVTCYVKPIFLKIKKDNC